MKVGDLYGRGKFGVSFEVYPPKSDAGEVQLMKALETLAAFHPAFVSCTYGAGGSTRNQTLELICRIRDAFRVTIVAHHTCVESSVDDIRAWLRHATDLGVENVMALRGDPPRGVRVFTPWPNGLAHANELVSLIRKEFPHFGIAVAGYPETHREAPSPEADLANLKRKVEAGADAVITQLFYDNADFFNFRRRYQAAGLRAPLIPGILPVINLAQIQRIASLCSAKIPAAFESALERYWDDPDRQMKVGIDYAVRQCQELVDAGVPGLHFYVLNRAEAPRQILEALRLPR